LARCAYALYPNTVAAVVAASAARVLNPNPNPNPNPNLNPMNRFIKKCIGLTIVGLPMLV
jgi:hypothetical protein